MCLQAIEYRKSYMQQYVKCLQEGKMGGDEAISEMDAQLNEHTILTFRKLAHAKASRPPLLEQRALDCTFTYVACLQRGRSSKPAFAVTCKLSSSSAQNPCWSAGETLQFTPSLSAAGRAGEEEGGC